MSLNRNNDGRVSNAETDPFIFGKNSQLRFYRHIICAPRRSLQLALSLLTMPIALRFLSFPVMKLLSISAGLPRYCRWAAPARRQIRSEGN